MNYGGYGTGLGSDPALQHSVLSAEQVQQLANGIVRRIQSPVDWGTLPTSIPIEANIVAWMARNGYDQPNQTTFDAVCLDKLLSSIAEQSADRTRAEMHFRKKRPDSSIAPIVLDRFIIFKGKKICWRGPFQRTPIGVFDYLAVTSLAVWVMCQIAREFAGDDISRQFGD